MIATTQLSPITWVGDDPYWQQAVARYLHTHHGLDTQDIARCLNTTPERIHELLHKP